jgi:ParB/RepB/Spo0J family partition protein
MAPKSKITDDLLAQIREAKQQNPAITQAQLGEQFGLNRNTIGQAMQLLEVKPLSADIEASGHVMDIDLDLLFESPLNYRRTFDEENLQGLADTIGEHGLQKNLTARFADGGRYEIIDGARRYRALKILQARGAWSQPVPCKVREATNAELRILSLLSNINSDTVAPLEEAQGFVDLQAEDPEKYSARNIARTIGRTPRYVNQRMALVKKLSPEAQSLLRDSQITVECARLLCTIDPAAQSGLLEQLADEYPDGFTATELRYEISHTFIPTSRALFDVAASGIATFDDEGDEFFLDKTEFWRLQDEAIEARRKELAEIWAWVDVIRDKRKLVCYWSDYITDGSAPRTEAGAIIGVDPNGLVHIETALLRREGAPSTDQPAAEDAIEPDDDEDTAAPRPPAPSKPAEAAEAKSPATKKHIYHAHARKTQALRQAVGSDPEIAMRLCCLALLRPNRAVKIQSTSFSIQIDDRVPTTPEHEAAINKYVGKIKKSIDAGMDDHKADLAIWKHIRGLDSVELNSLFAKLVARDVSTPAGFECNLGDYPLAIAIASDAGLQGEEEEHGLTLEREDLNGIRKQTLLHLADEFGTPWINDELSPKAIADAIASESSNHVVPTLRFATTAEIEKALGVK